MRKTPATIVATYRHVRPRKVSEFMLGTPRERFKRAIRELEEARARDTAIDVCCYVIAIGAVVALLVALA